MAIVNSTIQTPLNEHEVAGLVAEDANEEKGVGVAANSAKRQRGRPFKKGASGNPAGKSPGTRNRTTLAVQELLDGEAEKLTRRCVELALQGDSTALRLCMERLAPPPKDRSIDFPMPAASTAREINIALAKVAEAVGAGTLTPGEGNSLAALLEVHRRCIETADLEDRVERLEKETNEKGQTMSTRQIRTRVEKAAERLRPEHDGMFTWEEFSRLFELWRQDKQRFHEMANRADGSMYRSFMSRFELEDAERAAQR
jgi:hypothetical protein